ncbi:hypothetical protein KPH14_002452 [Odynerus spinipes]|uniref:Retrovirus-related Pol polyprotein from transposon TNT 1-94 n=1 Tax=Odynerus spinipes TaxID=1348599 RepID=A0AAD9VMB8_9HYME|nr:hypothetical protein KPH14_002452 [Odynerus spinipes]
MELLLIKEDLWDIVQKPKPENANDAWNKLDGKARATMGLMIEDNQLQHIKREVTAKGMWDALRKYHEKSTLTSKVFLLKRLCSLKLSETGDMEEHINNLLNLVDKLTALGETLGDHLVVAFQKVMK